MSQPNTLSTVLFVHTGGDWHEQNSVLLEALASATKEVIHAEPTASGAEEVETREGKTTIRYSPRLGLAGILRQAHQADIISGLTDLLTVSDQLLGPLAPLDSLSTSGESAGIEVLVIPEARSDIAEQHNPAHPELAGEIAMELPWLRVPHTVLDDAAFWRAVSLAEQDTEAELGWLDYAQLVRAVVAEGFEVSSIFEPSGDLFARSLEHYLSLGLPVLPWALFTANPLELERWAVIPRFAFEYVRASGYSEDLFWTRILQSCPPQTWYTNMALLNVLPNTAPANFRNELSTAVIAHVYYPEMLPELLEYASNVPDPAQLFITTDTHEKKKQLEAALRDYPRFQHWDVRTVTTNRGRDVTAFLLDCSDVLRDTDFDIVVKIHSKRSVQDPLSVSGWFKRHLLENLLQSPSHVQQIFRLFQEEPRLGMVMPPVVHMGVPTMGNGWTLNKEPAEEVAQRMGIGVPFDTVTPLSPYGSMFIARREALLPLLGGDYGPDDFPDHEQYRDGSLAHVVERLFSYAVFSRGYYARCVQTAELAEISATALQYKLDQVSQYIYPFANIQVKMLKRGGVMGLSLLQMRSHLKNNLLSRYPRIAGVASRASRLLRRTNRPVPTDAL